MDPASPARCRSGGRRRCHRCFGRISTASRLLSFAAAASKRSRRGPGGSRPLLVRRSSQIVSAKTVVGPRPAGRDTPVHAGIASSVLTTSRGGCKRLEFESDSPAQLARLRPGLAQRATSERQMGRERRFSFHERGVPRRAPGTSGQGSASSRPRPGAVVTIRWPLGRRSRSRVVLRSTLVDRGDQAFCKFVGA
jgi:hypothetical protein